MQERKGYFGKCGGRGLGPTEWPTGGNRKNMGHGSMGMWGCLCALVFPSQYMSLYVGIHVCMCTHILATALSVYMFVHQTPPHSHPNIWFFHREEPLADGR